MKKLVLLLLLLPGLPSATKAQCFTPYYSSYVSWTLQSDGATVGQIVSVSGYTLVGQSCLNQMQQSNATHYATVTNILGSAGGAENGPHTCPTCQMNWNDALYKAFTDGEEDDAQTGAAFYCTFAGLIFNAGVTDDGFVSIHRTTYKYASINPFSVCTYNVYCVLTDQICGADTTTVQGPCPQTYLITSWLKFRLGIHSTCFPVGAVLSNTWLACN
jgi:hypothetical protein